MIKYILTVTGAVSVEDAFSFFINQVHVDYGDDICKFVTSKGFKRSLLVNPAVKDHIESRFRSMHLNSPNEFVWMGHDDQDRSSYIVYGILPEV